MYCRTLALHPIAGSESKEPGSYCPVTSTCRVLTDAPQLDCDTKAAKIINPEFIAKCPAGCHDAKYRVYGTDVYAAFSSVCGAAIHRLAFNLKQYSE